MQCTNNDISRRSFISSAALAGAASIAVPALAMADDKDATVPEKGTWKGYTPGTYSSDAMGHNAPFTVNVTFTDYALSDIDTDGNLETIGVGKLALARLGDEIVKNQSLNVDGLTGASISSAALLGAVRDCAEQAGDTVLLDATPTAQQEPDEVYDTDVCVVGAGGAGFAAAIAAAQAGANVVVLEKCSIDGGSTNVSEGALNAVDPERQEPQGIEDSIDTFYQTTIDGGHGTGNPELVEYLVNNALDSVHWLEDLGVRFKDEVGSATGSLGQRSHYPYTPSGNTYIRSFEDFQAAHADQLLVLNDVQATDLILDDAGAVVGVKGLFNAKAVIIATGGFGANVEYRQSVNDGVWKEVVLDETIGCTNIQPCAQGEGLKLAEQAGAELINLSDIQLHPCGTPGTGLMEDIRTSGRNRIFVNESGDRFVNEGAERDTLCKAIFAQPDSTYFIVVNKLRYPDPDWVDGNGATVANMIARGHVVGADTVEELAEATGMDAAKLQASIDAYNAVVRGEAEDEFGFTADNTADAEMTEGPWYACQKVPTVHHTMGGLQINADAQVLDVNGKVIPGLYAAGETTGGIHGSNRLGGNAIADCMVFGRTAGTNAAQGK